MEYVQLIYPEKRKVSHEQIMLWAVDAFENNETPKLASTVAEAIEILEDLGHITVGRDVNPSGRAPFGWHL